MSKEGANIYTDGTYLLKNLSWHSEFSLWKAVEIDKIIKRNNLAPVSIADVGCGAGQILFHLSELHPAIKELKGFDISPQAIEMANKLQNDRLRFLVADFANEFTGNFELILVIDVIEHLTEYKTFLEKILPKGKLFIFHVPLDLSVRTIFKPHVLKQQRDDVGHLHYFTKDHVEWILEDTGYKIIDWFYTPSETDIKKAVSVKDGVKKFLRKVSFSLNKNISAKLWGGYSMMILASKNE